MVLAQVQVAAAGPLPCPCCACTLQVQAWRKAAQQAQQAAQALAAAGELLARLIRRHKLGGHKVRRDYAVAGAL